MNTLELQKNVDYYTVNVGGYKDKEINEESLVESIYKFVVKVGATCFYKLGENHCFIIFTPKGAIKRSYPEIVIKYGLLLNEDELKITLGSIGQYLERDVKSTLERIKHCLGKGDKDELLDSTKVLLGLFTNISLKYAQIID